MNVSERFIRRPVMTILVMVGDLLFGVIAYGSAADQRSADGRLSDDQRQRESARRESGDDGRGGRDAAREAVLDDRRHRQHDVDARASDRRRSRCSSRSTATSMQPRRTFRPRSRKHCGSFRWASRRRRIRRRTRPRRRFTVRADVDNAPDLPQLDEVGETMIAQRLSMIDGVAQVQVFGAAKYAVRVQLDPTALAYRKIGIDEVADGDQRAERQPADGRALGPDDRVHASGERPAARTPPQFRAMTRRVSERRRGSARRARPRARRRGEQPRARAGSTACARSCSPCSGSPARTPSQVANAVRAELDSMRAADSERRADPDAVRSVGRHRAVGAAT